MTNAPPFWIDVGGDATGVTVTVIGEIDIATIGRLQRSERQRSRRARLACCSISAESTSSTPPG